MSLGKIFKKMTNQSGRTMTEILGVLVIIGVLSLTALLGFSYAMEAVRENETLNRAAKIIAAARTGYILQDHGYNTKYYVDEDKVERLYDEYQPQSINMHDVISNIGDDFSDDDTYILAPLKGPFKDGNEQNVKIYVRVETPFAFTVRFDNLTKQACMKIVMARNLGYSWGYETADAAAHWMDPTMLMNEANAESLCNRVVGLTSSDSATLHELFLNNPFVKQAFAQTSSASGTLVLWFGPYSTLDPEGAYPSCADSDCCCDLDDEGNLYLVGRAGCSRPAYGTCVSCTYENSEGICVQKDGVTCPASDVCGETKCQSGQFECGDVCCLKGQTCNDGVCEGDPDAGYCADTQTQCGDNCCNEGEICNDDGECVVDPCPASEGKFWCVQDKVCCNANEKCQNAQCIQVCDDNQTLCGDICCDTANNEICNEERCVQINPKCERKDWQPYYVGQVPLNSCTGDNGVDCCYEGEECCNGLCCIYGYTCKNNYCVYDTRGDYDDECTETCCESVENAKGCGGVKYVDANGNDQCCCSPAEVISQRKS